jgi:Domain of unknown function (DUF4193)
MTEPDNDFEAFDIRRTARSHSPTDIEDEASGTVRPIDGEESTEDTMVAVEPMRDDEFRCSRCFLVWHRSHLAEHRGGERICQECG